MYGVVVSDGIKYRDKLLTIMGSRLSGPQGATVILHCVGTYFLLFVKRGT